MQTRLSYSASVVRRLILGVGVVLAVGLACVTPGTAAKLYKYRDASGRWVFSDRPIEGMKPLVVQQLRVGEREGKVSLRSLPAGETLRLAAVNQLNGPAEVEVVLENPANVAADPPLPLRRVVPAGSELTLARLNPLDPALPCDYACRLRYVPGDPAARHRPPQPYLVPFVPGKRFRISQAFNGKTSHRGPGNRYAVDISMPEGTPIRAVRDGVIMDVAFDYFEGGLDRDAYGGRANLVRILHDDGTMAVYVHLRLESVRYPVGARVKAGNVIAEAGNTGYTSGPHLHFAVQRNSGMYLESIPFVFAGAGGKPLKPIAGEMLLSY